MLRGGHSVDDSSHLKTARHSAVRGTFSLSDLPVPAWNSAQICCSRAGNASNSTVAHAAFPFRDKTPFWDLTTLECTVSCGWGKLYSRRSSASDIPPRDEGEVARFLA